LETVNGGLASRWERTDDGLALDVEIPWNTTARVRAPVDPASATVTADEAVVWADGDAASLPEGVDDAAAGDGAVVLTVGSGSYQFDVQY